LPASTVSASAPALMRKCDLQNPLEENDNLHPDTFRAIGLPTLF